MLLSQPVSRDFLSCCDNIMAKIRCKYFTKCVVPVARKYLHVLWLWLNSLHHSAVMTYVQSLCRRQSFIVSIISVNLWDYWTLCVHVFWWQISLLMLTGTEIHRKTISRVHLITWKQRVQLITWQIVRWTWAKSPALAHRKLFHQCILSRFLSLDCSRDT